MREKERTLTWRLYSHASHVYFLFLFLFFPSSVFLNHNLLLLLCKPSRIDAMKVSGVHNRKGKLQVMHSADSKHEVTRVYVMKLEKGKRARLIRGNEKWVCACARALARALDGVVLRARPHANGKAYRYGLACICMRSMQVMLKLLEN